ncbi:MAG: formylglycine-generating enzyme family protein [Opitutae bacterium]|nr:formylglycine-generating enzyme family protein [Opitutae bacterium]
MVDEAAALKREAEDALKPKGPSPGDVQTVDLGGGVKLELVWCPAGSYTRGSPANEAGRSDDETQHRVTLTKGFWMGKHEVTQAQWEAVTGSNPSHFKNAGKSAPVESVSWDDCQEFVRKLNARVPGAGFRLPTEAEWEYACRAPSAGSGQAGTSAFHYGNDLDATMANFDGNYPYGNGRKGEYRQTTVAVGTFRPNAWGLYDMHGNVWEWCQDWYGDYPTGSVTDPAGPGSGSFRVYRGGGWYSSARGCRSASRYGSDPGSRSGILGLRLARDPQ